MPKKTNIKNPKDMNGKAERVVKDYSKGTIAKGKHDVASKNVKKKYGVTGKRGK